MGNVRGPPLLAASGKCFELVLVLRDLILGLCQQVQSAWQLRLCGRGWIAGVCGTFGSCGVDNAVARSKRT